MNPMCNTWHNGMMFGIGLAAAVVGLCETLIGPIPDDWTLIPVGGVIMALALWSQWSSWRRKGVRAQS